MPAITATIESLDPSGYLRESNLMNELNLMVATAGWRNDPIGLDKYIKVNSV